MDDTSAATRYTRWLDLAVDVDLASGGAMGFDEEALMAVKVSEESVVGSTDNNRWP
jgi:hypothetical protein